MSEEKDRPGSPIPCGFFAKDEEAIFSFARATAECRPACRPCHIVETAPTLRKADAVGYLILFVGAGDEALQTNFAHNDLIHVAPNPRFVRLNRPHQRMLRGVEVFRRVRILR